MRQLLCLALERIEELEVVAAQDGMDGLRKITSDSFDLVLVDINMPVLDGLKPISLIRAEPDLAEIPLCVITTEGAEGDPERALALGADEYLTKPIEQSRVATVARSLLKLA